jgi:hypothetical protein
MSAAKAATRRVVHYSSLDEFQAEAEHLAKGKFRTIGNWSFSEILDHLAKTMTASVDGFGFKAPWWARVLIAPLMKNSFLTKTMKPGFKLPKAAWALMPANALSPAGAMENLRTALARVTNEPANAEHPFLGKLASQEWTSLHLRHAELHMSFVVPEESF